MLSQVISGFHWFINLFDPPPLETLTFRQKVARIVFVSVSLVTSCILLAMFAAVLLFLEDCWRQMLRNTPNMIQGLLVIFAGITVNAGCVYLLLLIRRMDAKVVPRRDHPGPSTPPQ